MGQGNVKKTTDGGKTFTSAYTFGWPHDLYFKDSLNGIGVDGAATIHKTTNGGNSWISFALAYGGDFYRVSFINNFTGFTVANGTNEVYRTTNFGSNWSVISILEDVQESIRSIKFSSDSVGWIGGNYYRLYKSTNQGLNWNREVITQGFILDITSQNDSVLWTCGTLGSLYKTTNGGEPLVGIENTSKLIPEYFNLHQNYPNPFNSSTKFSFDIREKGKYSLEIYNIKGELIERLMNKYLVEGTYKFNYNAGVLHSGVYFYKLSSDKFFMVKKFILSK